MTARRRSLSSRMNSSGDWPIRAIPDFTELKAMGALCPVAHTRPTPLTTIGSAAAAPGAISVQLRLGAHPFDVVHQAVDRVGSMPDQDQLRTGGIDQHAI